MKTAFLSALVLASFSFYAQADALSDLQAKVAKLEENSVKLIRVPIQSWVGQPTPRTDAVMVSYDFQTTAPVSVLAVLDGNLDLNVCSSNPNGCNGRPSYTAPMQMTAMIQKVQGTSVSTVAQRIQMNALSSFGNNVGGQNIIPYSHNLSANLMAPGPYRLVFSVHQNDIGAVAARLYNASLILAPITLP